MNSAPREEKGTVLLPRYSIGGDAYAGFPGAARPANGRVLVAGGEKALAAAWGELEGALAGSGLTVTGPVRCGGNCTMKAALGLARRAEECGAGLLAGVGGGRALDTVKACGQLTGLPVVTLPTIAATCAAVTALSILYRDDGSFERFLFLDAPPAHAFIHTGVIARAPAQYLRAGMGDSLAKYFESAFAARGARLGYRDSLALAAAATCYGPLLDIGAEALRDCGRGTDSLALKTAVQCCVVSTGIVSLLISEEFNGALAHSLYYALEALPAVREGCLHGDVVAWGTLVQLLMDGQEEKAAEVLGLLRSLGAPACLADLGVDPAGAGLRSLLKDAARQPDMERLPYPVSPQMILDAVVKTEAFAGGRPRRERSRDDA